jgi:protein disulfide-isomerase
MTIMASMVCARAELNWLTDFEAAAAKGKSDNKLVLLNFTGSDWCGWCKRLNAEVFSKPQFQEYAAKNLVLVELDFPRFKQQSDAVKKQNGQLASKYQIEGFPTVVVLNAAGKVVGELGYMQGGADAFIAALEQLRKS